jgi:hypothetical protein
LTVGGTQRRVSSRRKSREGMQKDREEGGKGRKRTPDGTGLNAVGDAEGTGDVAGEDSRGETVHGVVGLGDNIVLVLAETREKVSLLARR